MRFHGRDEQIYAAILSEASVFRLVCAQASPGSACRSIGIGNRRPSMSGQTCQRADRVVLNDCARLSPSVHWRAPTPFA